MVTCVCSSRKLVGYVIKEDGRKKQSMQDTDCNELDNRIANPDFQVAGTPIPLRGLLNT